MIKLHLIDTCIYIVFHVSLLQLQDAFIIARLSLSSLLGVSRSSFPEVFCKKSVLRNITKPTGKRLSLLFNKVAGIEDSGMEKNFSGP